MLAEYIHSNRFERWLHDGWQTFYYLLCVRQVDGFKWILVNHFHFIALVSTPSSSVMSAFWIVFLIEAFSTCFGRIFLTSLMMFVLLGTLKSITSIFVDREPIFSKMSKWMKFMNLPNRLGERLFERFVQLLANCWTVYFSENSFVLLRSKRCVIQIMHELESFGRQIQLLLFHSVYKIGNNCDSFIRSPHNAQINKSI